MRELALSKLADEAFNAEVAATLATLAPAPHRTAVVKAIVALEVLFDYLDGRTEALLASGSGDHDDVALGEGRRLSGCLAAVISGQAPSLSGADGWYLDALWGHAHKHLWTLPSAGTVARPALAAARRCAEGQLRLHATGARGEVELARWAAQACQGSGLQWREYVGGCASSVLAMHALIATAARPGASEAEAWALDEAYLAIGAIITTLDSVVDDAQDRLAGAAGYIRLYDDRGEIQERLQALTENAILRARRAPDGAHHVMTLAGVAAYYTTHPGAAEPQNRAIRARVRGQLAPAIWPALAVLMTWRVAKRTRRALGATATSARQGVNRPSAPAGGVR